jgi:ribose transport system substrate-binding protein
MRPSRTKTSTRFIVAGVAAVSLLGLAGLGTAGAATQGRRAPAHVSTKSSIVIGYSQSWTGNAFRKEQDADFVAVASAWVKSGKIAGYDLLDANNSVSTQVTQIVDLILKRVSLIIIDPSSPTGLNGAIARAKQAGIPVLVVSDGPVTSTIPYEIYGHDNVITEDEVQYIAKELHGKGNVLEVQGIAGYAAEAAFQSGMSFKAYPGIKVVGSVYGDWSESATESAVASILPSLPTVNAVITATGESYGAAEAFQAAGRTVPLIPGGGDAAFIQWVLKHPGYHTVSYSPDPGIGYGAAYVGLDILNHVKVPKTMIFPSLTVTQSQFAPYATFPATWQLQGTWGNAWVTKNLLG